MKGLVLVQYLNSRKLLRPNIVPQRSSTGEHPSSQLPEQLFRSLAGCGSTLSSTLRHGHDRYLLFSGIIVACLNSYLSFVVKKLLSRNI